ncbi:sigma-E factor negative regulatory protein [Idiomarina abyssalis]|jgi:sigma-E factor negative regulatory protein RseA|uniref:sigma-E factor negative regulatory protein n=1 Tax=Idiomarina abyssalis TaxID=86102 RepID=UPI0006C8A60A|nr:RseA family anti-sigma factor [Idiomarina abyssalis]KPD22817.1 negative regulator of sigma E activity [Idiomarina abyssalis]SFT48186.1 anti sigma-E protein, RseA [Idiomarina abyssalis]
MSRNKSESTSALFDDQVINADEIEALLDDEQATQEWHRYSVIRAAIKGDLNADISLDISEQVRISVNEESNKVVTPGFGRSKSQNKAASRWFQPFAKVAVAASVAVVAVMTVQTYQQPATPEGGSAEPALLTSPIGGGREPVSLNRVEPMSQINDQQRRRQVQSYMIDHQQQLMLQQKAESEEKQSEQELNKGN